MYNALESDEGPGGKGSTRYDLCPDDRMLVLMIPCQASHGHGRRCQRHALRFPP